MASPQVAMNITEFIARRKRVLATMDNNSVMILAAGSEKIRSQDTHFNFRPNSDFFYLTGFTEPNAWLVLRPGCEQQTIIFCQPKDKEKEIWDGLRLGEEAAVDVLRIDAAFSTADLDKEMPKLLQSMETLYYPLTQFDWMDKKVNAWIKSTKSLARKGISAPQRWIDSNNLIHEMRLIKSEAEINAIRNVTKLTAQAHIRAMERCKPDIYEYQLEAEYLHEFIRHGCTGTSYTSIVGGGNNACILHYTENADKLTSGDLVLIDAGGELDYYAGDVTRTFPINGRFSEAQKKMYQIVLNAQLAAIDKVKPGNSFNDPHAAAVESLTQSLISLGWINSSLEKAIEEEAYKTFYMHKTGHWLGLDVHDVGKYKIDGAWRTLEPGMCLTVEPGLYIPADQEKVPEEFRGIGIRIEDDVLVTEHGNEVLTANAPKTIDEIEALMNKLK